MLDPAATLLRAIEDEAAQVQGVKLRPAADGPKNLERLAKLMGRAPSAGLEAFFRGYDGGSLGDDVRLLSFEESLGRVRGPGRTIEMKGLWPVIERIGRVYALDAEGAEPDGEWPVVEVAGRNIDRVGTSFLRFVHTLLAELRAPEGDDLALVEEFCRRDPGFAEHWIDRAEMLDRKGRHDDVERILAEGIHCSTPPGPSLVLAAGLRAFDRGEDGALRAAVGDALALEPLTARDDDARLDAAAIAWALAVDDKDERAAARGRELLGTAVSSTGGYWRGEAIRAIATGNQRRVDLALKVVLTLVPEDEDVLRLRGGAHLDAAATALVRARDALDQGDAEDGARAARAAVAERPDLGIAHAVLAECLNAMRDRSAATAAEKATVANPAMMEGWRELGEAHLESRQSVKAEAALRELCRRDETNGLALAKLAQALLEQGRMLEALDAVGLASDRGGDPFFISAVKGDVLAEMNRHDDAALAYDQALRVDPQDHWALHQAALEHARAGNAERATWLFERAMEFDRDGCHQTLIDYAELLRRLGRIGDAVRLYRKAVVAVPNDPEWRQFLREAEKELQLAPN